MYSTSVTPLVKFTKIKYTQCFVKHDISRIKPRNKQVVVIFKAGIFEVVDSVSYVSFGNGYIHH
jgi:hypothetical protein